MIHLQETSLTTNVETEETSINGYEGQFFSAGNGKGIATYCLEDTICLKEAENVSQTLQIAKFKVGGISLMNVYRSSNHSVKETAKLLKSFIDEELDTLVTGDFNVCAVKEETNAITKMLGGLGFQLLVKDATHIQGGHIDHCYWLDRSMKWEIPKLERYSPYHSDHDALLITLKKKLKEESK